MYGSNLVPWDPSLRIEPSDTCGSLSKNKRKGLIERVIYGSDGPQRPGFIAEYLERNLYAMEKNDYTLEEVKLILSKYRSCLWIGSDNTGRPIMTSMMWFSLILALDTGFLWTRAYINYEISDALSTYVFFEQASSQE